MQGLYCPGDVHWARWEASALGSLCCLPRVEEREDILAENRDLYLPHLHLMRPLGDHHQTVAMTFGTEKWFGYLMVKRF